MNLFKIAGLTIIFIIFTAILPATAQEDGFYTEPEISYASGKVLEITKEEKNNELFDTFQTEQI
ncbi:MAG: hypothetical protein KAQ92_05215, partial [Candidatus Aenigmarchaeota archaeon]|nr:hypothetical protein [Candidatus Aenigmarchaeota archaeon]